jgi:hypothetical protein
MANNRKISEIVDIAAAKKQFDELKNMLNTAKKDILEFPSIYGNAKSGNSSFSEFIKESDTLKQKQTEMISTIGELNTANDKRLKIEHDLAVAEAKKKIQAAENNKAIKEEAKEALGLNDAYAKLNKQYNEAAKNAKNVAVQQGLNSKAAQEATKRAKELGDELKKVDAAVGQNQRKVGAYAEGVREGLGMIAPAATEAGEKIKSVGGILSKLSPMGVGVGLALAGGLAILGGWLEKTQAGMEFLKVSTGAFKASMDQLGGTLIGLFSKTDENFFKKWADFLNPGKMQEKQMVAAQAGAAIAREGIRLAKEERAETVENSRLHLEIVKLKEKSLNSSLSINQKTELLNEGLKTSLKLEDNKVERAKKELDLINFTIETKRKAGIYDIELLNKRAEQEAKINDIQAESIQNRRRLEKELQNDLKEMRKEEVEYNMTLIKQDYIVAKDYNDRILQNDKSTYAQKYMAMQSNLSLELKLLDQERDAKLREGGLSQKKALTIIEETNNQQIALRRKYAADERKNKEEELRANQNAEFAMMKNSIELEKDSISQKLKIDQTLYESQLNLHVRSVMQQRVTDLETQQENNDFNQKLLQASGKTNKEKEAMAEEHQRNLTSIANKGQLDQIAIQKEFYKKEMGKVQEGEMIKQTKDLDDYTRGLTEIDNKLKSGKISLKEFDKAKKDMDDNMALKSINDQIMNLDKQRNIALSPGNNDYKTAEDLDKQIAELQKQSVERKIELNKRTEKSDEALHQKEIELVQKSSEMILKFENGRLDKEKSENDHRISLIEDNSNAEKSAIEKSTMSEQQKSDALNALAVKTQMEKEKLENKNKELELKKAKNDKVLAIFQAIIGTAESVAKASSIPEKIIAGVMGAAAIATIIATPVPKYAGGRMGGPATFALTDERGPEGYVTSSGQFYMGSNTPNLKYLDAGTRVIPHEQLNSYMMQNMINPGKEPNLSKKLDQVIASNLYQTQEITKALKKNRPILRTTIKVENSDWIRQQISH